MATNKTNPIANMAETLAKPKANPKADKKPATIPEFQLVEMGSEMGNAYLGVVSASESLETIRQKVVKTGFKPIDLRKAKSDPEGAKATKIFKDAFLDTLAGKVKAKTAQDYFELVADSIRKDKPIVDTNAHRKGKGGKGQKSNGGQDDASKMLSALKNVWTLSDVAGDALTKIESSIDDGMSLIEAITDYLKSEGIELEQAEA